MKVATSDSPREGHCPEACQRSWTARRPLEQEPEALEGGSVSVGSAAPQPVAGSGGGRGAAWQADREHARLCERHGGRAPRPVRGRGTLPPAGASRRAPGPTAADPETREQQHCAPADGGEDGRQEQRPLGEHLVPPHRAASRAYGTRPLSSQACRGLRRCVWPGPPQKGRSTGPTDGDGSPLSTAGKRQARSLTAWVQIPPFLFVTYETQASGLTSLRSRPPLVRQEQQSPRAGL